MAAEKLVWSHDAKRDIQRLHEFLTAQNPLAADEAVWAIIKGSEELSKNPEIGRPYLNSKPYREMIIPFGSRAYIIRYRYVEGTVFVVKIWHGAENRA